MPANTDPIYSKAGDVQVSSLINAAAAVVYNGSGTIGTDVYKIWTADATNGGFLERVRYKYVANATTSSINCVIKTFLCSVTSGAVTDANCILYDETIALASGTLSTTVAGPLLEVAFGFAIPSGWCVVCKITVAQPASCGFVATGIGGKY